MLSSFLALVNLDLRLRMDCPRARSTPVAHIPDSMKIHVEDKGTFAETEITN